MAVCSPASFYASPGHGEAFETWVQRVWTPMLSAVVFSTKISRLYKTNFQTLNTSQPSESHKLKAGEVLSVGERLTSPNGRFALINQNSTIELLDTYKHDEWPRGGHEMLW
jgi:hypothetical protein